jgi:hypothetical protein
MQQLNRVKLKKFWKPDGLDFKADLGIMKNAIVVRCCKEKLCDKDSFYQISLASHFPFTEELYNKKFDSYLEACETAENYIMDWMRSILVSAPENEPIILTSSSK